MNEMQARVRASLLEIVTRYGREVLEDPRRCRALLMDFCGDCRGEIHLLETALQEGVVEDLAAPPPGVPEVLLFGRLIRRLQDHYYVPEAAAWWAVESCALALEIEPPAGALGGEARTFASALPATVLGRRWADVDGPWQELGATPGRVVVPAGFEARLNLYANDGDLDVLVQDLADFGPLAYMDVSYSPLTDAGLVTLQPVGGLLYLDLSGTRITDAGMPAITAHTKLVALYLRGCEHLTARGLSHLRAFRGLESLDLGRCVLVQDGALAPLGTMIYLTWLNLAGTRVTDDGLAHLARLAHLQTLDLSETGLTGRALTSLATLSSLETLSLYRCVDLHPRWLTGLPRFPRLTRLDLSGCGLITDRALVSLRALHGLVDLGLAGLEITDAGVLHLASLVGLRSLDLSWTRVGDLGMERLVSLAGLRTLGLAGTRITDRGVTIITRAMPDLVSLDLSNTRVTYQGLASLATLGALGELNLEGTDLDDAGLAPVSQISSLTHLYLGDTGVTDEGLKMLDGMDQLAYVDVTLCPNVTPAGLAALAASDVVVEA